MNVMSMKKQFFCAVLLLFIFCMTKISAFSFTDFTTPLSNAFSNLTGANTGMTSFQSLNIPVGGRAESMGSAFAGLANDISFFDYNPAASCLLDNTELAFFHNTWIADSAIETLAGTIRLNHLGLGAQLKVFYVPFTEYDGFGERVANSYYTETTATFNVSYNFFPGYKFKGLALGASFKMAWRGVPDYADNTTGGIISGSGLSQSGLGLMADVGIMFRFNAAKFFASRQPNMSIGISFLNIGTAITGFGKKVILDDPLPSAMSLGFSWRIFKPFTLSLEFRQPFMLQNFTLYQTWSISIGMAATFTNFFSLLGGFQIKGANPRITFGAEFIIKRATFNINYTLDLTSSLSPVNRFTVAAKINLGDRGRGDKQCTIDELYSEGLEYYSNGQLEEAIKVWSDILKLDPFFDPAKDGIKNARLQLEFYQQIIDAQFIN